MIVQNVVKIIYRIEKKGPNIKIRRILYNKSKNRS
jgi:hypothetical protein